MKNHLITQQQKKNRQEKIKFLQNLSLGRIRLGGAFENPDFTKLTDDELRQIATIQQKINQVKDYELNDEENSFMDELHEALILRNPGYGLKPENSRSRYEELSDEQLEAKLLEETKQLGYKLIKCI